MRGESTLTEQSCRHIVTNFPDQVNAGSPIGKKVSGQVSPVLEVMSNKRSPYTRWIISALMVRSNRLLSLELQKASQAL